jgi:hypothetical protein
MHSYYECNSCNYKSPRKTNANRHIKLIHKGNALAFNFKTGTDSSSASNNSQIQKYSLEMFAEESQLTRAIDNIHRSFEILEKLSSVFPDRARYQYLSNILKISFLTKDPAKAIEDQIKENRSIFYLRKLAIYLANDKSISINEAEEYIKTSITSCNHLKKITDIKRTPKATQNSKEIDSLLSKASITCLFDKEQARDIIGRVLAIDPDNKIALSIRDFINTNTQIPQDKKKSDKG